MPGLALGISASTEAGGYRPGGLRGTGPALAGNVGTGGAFALSRGGNYRVSTFLRSLWSGPAPLDVFGGGLRGFGPALAGNVGRGRAFALNARGELGCGRSNARCEPNSLRLCHGVGLGVGPKYVSYAGPTPPTRLQRNTVGYFRRRRSGGSAGSVLRAQGSLRENELSRCARGVGLIASSACSGPIPPPPRQGGVKGFRFGVGPEWQLVKA